MQLKHWKVPNVGGGSETLEVNPPVVVHPKDERVRIPGKDEEKFFSLVPQDIGEFVVFETSSFKYENGLMND